MLEDEQRNCQDVARCRPDTMVKSVYTWTVRLEPLLDAVMRYIRTFQGCDWARRSVLSSPLKRQLIQGLDPLDVEPAGLLTDVLLRKQE